MAKYWKERFYKMPSFFVPEIAPENQEAEYKELAKWCSRAAPNMGDRIYSITFVHNGEEWTATVGEALRGKNIKTSRSVLDPATVLAIFPSVPYMVVTNSRINPNIISRWENPFMAGKPSQVIYFD